MNIPKAILSILISSALSAIYLIFNSYGHPEFFLIMIIICITGIFTMAENREQTGKFDGYVCEICGADYDKCTHSTEVDYTLIKKA